MLKTRGLSCYFKGVPIGIRNNALPPVGLSWFMRSSTHNSNTTPSSLDRLSKDELLPSSDVGTKSKKYPKSFKDLLPPEPVAEPPKITLRAKEIFRAKLRMMGIKSVGTFSYRDHEELKADAQLHAMRFISRDRDFKPIMKLSRIQIVSSPHFYFQFGLTIFILQELLLIPIHSQSYRIGILLVAIFFYVPILNSNHCWLVERNCKTGVYRAYFPFRNFGGNFETFRTSHVSELGERSIFRLYGNVDIKGSVAYCPRKYFDPPELYDEMVGKIPPGKLG